MWVTILKNGKLVLIKMMRQLLSDFFFKEGDRLILELNPDNFKLKYYISMFSQILDPSSPKNLRYPHSCICLMSYLERASNVPLNEDIS